MSDDDWDDGPSTFDFSEALSSNKDNNRGQRGGGGRGQGRGGGGFRGGGRGGGRRDENGDDRDKSGGYNSNFSNGDKDYGGGRKDGGRMNGFSRNDDEDDERGGGRRGGSRGGRGRGGGSYGRRNDGDNDNEDSGFRGGPRGGGRGRGRGGSFGGNRRNGDDNEGGGWSWDDNKDSSDSRGFNRSNDNDRGFGGGRGGFNKSDDNDRGFGGGRGRGSGRGGRGARSGGDRFGNKEDTENGEGNEEKPAPVTYIPPEEEGEDSLFASGISSGINFSKYDSIDIKVSGENAPKPIKNFDSCGLRDLLVENISRSGYKVPTPVQKNSIPIISAKRDLMACAQTGSGKTGAFLIPIINNLLNDKEDLITGSCVEPHCVILSPTRELCIQIYDEARKFANQSYLKIAKLYGGVQVSYQSQKLVNGCHILVSTPGRLLDFVTRGKVKFSSVKYLVLDEGDRMLDLGFLPDIEKVFQHSSMVPCGERVTLLFSATFPHDIQELAAKFLHNYLFLAVGIVGGACADVNQHIFAVSKFDKRDKLMEIMKARENENELTLIFVETKRNADFLAVFLCENDFKTTSIHGDRFQEQREEALRDFKTGRMPTLVATAVAARGLDIKNVAHVINYDLPKTIDEYVHRIGRTGRVGNRGRATSFFDSRENGQLAQPLIKILEQAGQEVPSFLNEWNSRSDANDGGFKSFGGTDFRDDDCSAFKTNNRTVPQQLEEEEEWD